MARRTLALAAVALATLLARPPSASAGPRVIRVQKGLPGQWPGLALVPGDAEAIGFFSVPQLTAWAERQAAGGGAGPADMLDDIVGEMLGPDVDHKAVTNGARSVLIAVASSANRPGDMMSGLVIIGGSFDEKALDTALAQALTLSERVNGHPLYIRKRGRREPEVVALLPGGIAYGHQGWVRSALTRFGSRERPPGRGDRPESPPARVARTRVPALAAGWGTLSPGAGTRAQLGPIKPFLASIEGAAWMLAPRGEPHANLALRLSFATAAHAREAAAFMSQIFGLPASLASSSKGFEASLLQALAALSNSLRVEGTDLVADITR